MRTFIGKGRVPEVADNFDNGDISYKNDISNEGDISDDG